MTLIRPVRVSELSAVRRSKQCERCRVPVDEVAVADGSQLAGGEEAGDGGAGEGVGGGGDVVAGPREQAGAAAVAGEEQAAGGGIGALGLGLGEEEVQI